MLLFEAVRAGSLVVDGLVFWFVLRRLTLPGGVPGGITLGPVLAAVLAATTAFVGKMIPLVAVGLGMFGVMAFAYADLVVLVPLIGAALLWRAKRVRLSPVVRGLAVTSLALPLVGVYASCIEPHRLVSESAHLTIAADRAGEAPIVVGVLADLQTDRVTDHEREAVDRLIAASPDIILIPGDVFQGTTTEYARERDAMRALLARLQAPGGVFVVSGNCDSPTNLREMIAGTAIRLLDNEIVRVAVRGRIVTLGGIELDYRSAAAQSVIDRLQRGGDDADIRILVGHLPDSVLALEDGSRIDLVVAGHTHGGQVQLPLLGPPITLSNVPRRVAAGGLHDHRGNAIYVSRGVGMERHYAPRIRFLCPPEISLLTVGGSRPAETNTAPGLGPAALGH